MFQTLQSFMRSFWSLHYDMVLVNFKYGLVYIFTVMLIVLIQWYSLVCVVLMYICVIVKIYVAEGRKVEYLS